MPRLDEDTSGALVPVSSSDASMTRLGPNPTRLSSTCKDLTKGETAAAYTWRPDMEAVHAQIDVHLVYEIDESEKRRLRPQCTHAINPC